MPVDVFRASRWTRENLFFPTEIEVNDTFVVRRKRGVFRKNEISMHLKRVSSVRIETGVLWSDILIESSGGTDAIRSHGHRKEDALRIKQIIADAQQEHLGSAGDTRPCPFCAEAIKIAAKVCRFCNRDVPATG